MRYWVAASLALVISGCGGGSAPPKPAAKAEPVKITQFYASDPKIPKGEKGTLCYGVEHASRVQLSPPVEEVWPAATRCFEISPKQNMSYTLTAFGEDGSRAEQTVAVTVGAAAPRLYDLSVNSQSVHAGEQVVVCFKVENAATVKAGPGHFDAEANCVTDRPVKTTSYNISAISADGKADSGTVTVKVH